MKLLLSFICMASLTIGAGCGLKMPENPQQCSKHQHCVELVIKHNGKHHTESIGHYHQHTQEDANQNTYKLYALLFGILVTVWVVFIHFLLDKWQHKRDNKEI